MVYSYCMESSWSKFMKLYFIRKIMWRYCIDFIFTKGSYADCELRKKCNHVILLFEFFQGTMASWLDRQTWTTNCWWQNNPSWRCSVSSTWIWIGSRQVIYVYIYYDELGYRLCHALSHKRIPSLLFQLQFLCSIKLYWKKIWSRM